MISIPPFGNDLINSLAHFSMWSLFFLNDLHIISSVHQMQYICTFCSDFGFFMVFHIEGSQCYVLKSSISSYSVCYQLVLTLYRIRVSPLSSLLQTLFSLWLCACFCFALDGSRRLECSVCTGTHNYLSFSWSYISSVDVWKDFTLASHLTQ